jgi:hypothetical protein
MLKIVENRMEDENKPKKLLHHGKLSSLHKVNTGSTLTPFFS